MTVPAADAAVLLGVTKTNFTTFGGASYIIDWNGAASGGKVVTFNTAAANTRVAIMARPEGIELLKPSTQQ